MSSLLIHEALSQKSEDNLAIAESEASQQQRVVSDLQRQNEELQTQADLAMKLKDQVDESVIYHCLSTTQLNA